VDFQNYALDLRLLVRGESVAFFSPSFKSRRTARIVFQLRVVAGTPNSLSIWPRYLIVFM
jgi:hypothetical protein